MGLHSLIFKFRIAQNNKTQEKGGRYCDPIWKSFHFTVNRISFTPAGNWIVPLSSACLVQVGQDGVETWENVTCSPLSMIHCNNKVERSAALAPLSALPPPGFSFMWNHFVDQRQENLQLLEDWSHPPHDACSVPPCMARCRWQQYFYISLQKEFVPC